MFDSAIKSHREAAAASLVEADKIRQKYLDGSEWSAEDSEKFDRVMAEFRTEHGEAEKLQSRANTLAEHEENRALYMERDKNKPGVQHRGTGSGRAGEREERLASQHDAMHRYIVRGENALTPDERNALISSTGDLGGFTVPEDFVPELLRDLAGFSVFRPMARVRSTTRDAIVFPAFASGTDPESTDYDVLSQEWVTEADLVTAVTTRQFQDKPTFERLRIPIHIWSPKPLVLSHTLLQDSAINIESEIREVIAETRALREDLQFISGDGVNKPRGILADVAAGDIATVSSGAAATVTYNGLVDLWVSLPAQYRQNATWLMNSASFGEILKLADDQNRPLIDVNTLPLNLWTRPIRFSEYMPSPGAGADNIIFGNFNYYGIADREDMMLIRLGELYAPSVALLPVARVGGQVLRFGAFRVGRCEV